MAADIAPQVLTGTFTLAAVALTFGATVWIERGRSKREADSRYNDELKVVAVRFLQVTDEIEKLHKPVDTTTEKLMGYASTLDEAFIMMELVAPDDVIRSAKVLRLLISGALIKAVDEDDVQMAPLIESLRNAYQSARLNFVDKARRALDVRPTNPRS